jgi:hypothetical protein
VSRAAAEVEGTPHVSSAGAAGASVGLDGIELSIVPTAAVPAIEPSAAAATVADADIKPEQKL